LPRLQTHEQKRKLRTSEAGCDESRTPRFNREVPRTIPGIDSTNLIQDKIRSGKNEIDDELGVSDGSQKRSDNKMSVAHYQQPHLLRIRKLQSS
jgi:hypothetical protein